MFAPRFASGSEMKPRRGNLYWLTDEQSERLRPYPLHSHGRPRLDDRRALSGIILVRKPGCAGGMAQNDYALHKSLESGWKRWGKTSAFVQIMGGLAAASAESTTVMIEAALLKDSCEASSLPLRSYGPPERTGCRTARLILNFDKLGRERGPRFMRVRPPVVG